MENLDEYSFLFGILKDPHGSYSPLLGIPFLDSFMTWGYDGGGLVIFGGHQVNIGGGL